MTRLMACCLIALNLALFLISSPASGRQMSKAGQIFQSAKDGVVTVFVSYGHGSGTLVDADGLILTNHHVVRENTGHLRVKLGAGEILEAQVIEVDRENDLAILRVNLSQVKHYGVIEPFIPEAGDADDPLVLVGEEIIAIGSPIDRQTLEKTMTTGIVGKYDQSLIHHDASVNNGNSGGPLLNYDGKQVGVNTFIQASNGPAIAGAIPIDKAQPLITSARKKMANLPLPSSELLPDVPLISFPVSHFLKTNPQIFLRRNQRQYNFSSQYFDVSVLTPPQGYYQDLKAEEAVLKRRNKRASKKGFEISDDEKASKNRSNYDYTKPVVTLYILPRPKLTTGSKVLNTVTFIAATGATVASFGAASPLLFAPFFMGKREIKKDFFKMNLMDESGNIACAAIETGRQPFTRAESLLTGLSYIELVDKSYVGRYTFDAKCFDTQKRLALKIDIEGKDADKTIPFPQATQKLIVSDFKPYWAYVSSLQPQQNQDVVQNVTAVVEENPQK